MVVVWVFLRKGGGIGEGVWVWANDDGVEIDGNRDNAKG